jgi:RimJ/RimL family protein N-acetyltransferase
MSAIAIETQRLRLRCWREGDRDAFAALHADPEVMRDYGGPLARVQSDEKFDRYITALRTHGFSRWVVETPAGEFLGYSGVMARSLQPVGPHIEIDWRLKRSVWGHGYATEAAQAALHDAFTRCRLAEVLAYTSPDNIRSQAVMARLNLHRDPSRDFDTLLGSRMWRGMVWIATPSG